MREKKVKKSFKQQLKLKEKERKNERKKNLILENYDKKSY